MMTQMNNSLEKVKKDQDALTMKLSQAETQETPTKEAEAPYVLDLTLLCATVKIPKSVILLKSLRLQKRDLVEKKKAKLLLILSCDKAKKP